MIVAQNVGPQGGGIMVQGEFATLDFVHVVDNAGTGIRLLSDAEVTLTNSNVSGNRDSNGGAINATDGILTATYSNFFDNGSTPFAGFTPDREGNLEVMPGLASTSGDVETWDFSLAAGSDLVDAGDPAVQDVDGTRADIGAYGGPEATW